MLEPDSYLIGDRVRILSSLNLRLIPYVAAEKAAFYRIATKMLHCDFTPDRIICESETGDICRSHDE